MFTKKRRLFLLGSALLLTTILVTQRGSPTLRHKMSNLQNIAHYQPIKSVEETDLSQLELRLKGPLTYDDPDLLEVIREKFIMQPSSLPYDLMMDKTDYRAGVYNSFRELEPSFLLIRDILLEILGDVKEGFFVEAGAVDGEFLSNTLALERRLGWKGLLVEADGDTFQKLQSRHRKAWASHCCLAMHEYPHQEVFIKYSPNGYMHPGEDMFSRGHGVLKSVVNISPMILTGSDPGQSIPSYEVIQCLPLASLLLAFNITHVDFISLDVEGAETAILNSFPWDVITVDVWLVEYFTASATQVTGSRSADTPEAHNHDIAWKLNIPKTTLHNSNNLNTHRNSNTANILDAMDTYKKMQSQLYDPNGDIEFLKTFSSRGYYHYPVDLKTLKNNYLFIRIDSDIYRKIVNKTGH